jgi:hypothetical protein
MSGLEKAVRPTAAVVFGLPSISVLTRPNPEDPYEATVRWGSGSSFLLERYRYRAGFVDESTLGLDDSELTKPTSRQPGRPSEYAHRFMIGASLDGGYWVEYDVEGTTETKQKTRHSTCIEGISDPISLQTAFPVISDSEIAPVEHASGTPLAILKQNGTPGREIAGLSFSLQMKPQDYMGRYV